MNKPKELNTYSLLIKESLDMHLTEWFHDVSMLPLDDGMTLLVGTFADHLPWREFLAHTMNLEVTVLAIEPVKRDIQKETKTLTMMMPELINS